MLSAFLQDGFKHRSAACDWGPIPSTFEGATWPQITLPSGSTAYGASNIAYIITKDWTFYGGQDIWNYITHGHTRGATANSNPSAPWYDACPAALGDNDLLWTQYKLEYIGEVDSTRISVAKINAQSSPGGGPVMVAFGGPVKPFNDAPPEESLTAHGPGTPGGGHERLARSGETLEEQVSESFEILKGTMWERFTTIYISINGS